MTIGQSCSFQPRGARTQPSSPSVRAESPDRQALRSIAPALAISCSLAILLGAVFVMQMLSQQDLYYVRKQEMLGFDLHDFFLAGQLWARGTTPYSGWRYVTPPLPAAISSLAVARGWQQFLAVGLVLSVLSCVSASVAVAHAFQTLRSSAGRLIALLGLCCLSISYPFMFLVDRGNIDGIVLGLMCGAILLSEGYWCLIGGTLLATAASLKLYPALLFVPMLLQRKRRLAGATVLALVVLTLITGVGSWREYLSSRLFWRGAFFRVNENGSLANFCHFLISGGANGEPAAARCAYVLFACLLGATVVMDVIAYRRGGRDWRSTALSYFPFMVAVPATVYHYSFVILLVLVPLLCAAARSATDRWARAAISLSCAGIVLTQVQAVALEKLLHAFKFPGQVALWAYFFPSLGLFLTMVGLLCLKLRRLAPDSQCG